MPKENLAGNVVSKRVFLNESKIRVAASSAEIKNGIGKSFLSVNGVLTKPGLIKPSEMPNRSHSGFSDSHILINAAFVAP